MAVDDREARKRERRNRKAGLLEGEAEESGSDYSEDDDEIDAERQAIHELRGIDYLAVADSDDDNVQEHRSLLARQLEQEDKDYFKARGDVFDEDGKIIRHGKTMKKLLRNARMAAEAEAAVKRARETSSSDSDSDETSDSSDDDAIATDSQKGKDSTGQIEAQLTGACQPVLTAVDGKSVTSFLFGFSSYVTAGRCHGCRSQRA